MTSSQFIKEVATKNGMTQKAVKEMADIFEIAIKEKVKNGETFKVFDVTFSVKDVPERSGFNPLTKEPATYPATKKVCLKPSVDLKKSAKGC